MFYNMMMGNNWGFGGNNLMGFGFSWVFMIVFWALIIWLIIALVKRLSHHDSCPCGKHEKDGSAIEILKERYAKGEINKQEFEEKKKDLAP